MKRIKITEKDEIIQRIKTHGIAHTDMGQFFKVKKAPRRIYDINNGGLMEIPSKERVHFRWNDWFRRNIL